MRTVKGGTWQGIKRWDRKMLLNLVLETGSVANAKLSVTGTTPVVTAMMVSIYKDEQAKLIAIDSFNTSAGYGASKSESDVGDFD